MAKIDDLIAKWKQNQQEREAILAQLPVWATSMRGPSQERYELEVVMGGETAKLRVFQGASAHVHTSDIPLEYLPSLRDWLCDLFGLPENAQPTAEYVCDECGKPLIVSVGWDSPRDSATAVFRVRVLRCESCFPREGGVGVRFVSDTDDGLTWPATATPPTPDELSVQIELNEGKQP